MENFIERVNGESFDDPSEFKEALLVELGLVNHPKADRLYELAWEYGHSYGYHEIYSYACDMAELLK